MFLRRVKKSSSPLVSSTLPVVATLCNDPLTLLISVCSVSRKRLIAVSMIPYRRRSSYSPNSLAYTEDAYVNCLCVISLTRLISVIAAVDWLILSIAA